MKKLIIFLIVLIIFIVGSLKIKEYDSKYYAKIKNYIEGINQNDEFIDDVLYKEIYGEDLEDYIIDLGEEGSLGARVYTDNKNFVGIIPYSDFLNNQYFYFKDNKFVAYIKEFCGIGGKIKYYFRYGKLIKVEEEVEEDFEVNQEEEKDILSKANEVYNKYIKKSPTIE